MKKCVILKEMENPDNFAKFAKLKFAKADYVKAKSVEAKCGAA